jgi:phosphatidylglycerol:prolipoprotein diacylglycerol transferase
MLPILQIGPLALQAPGLILILGVWFGLNTAERYAARFKSQASPIYNLVLLGLLAGILSARLAYAVQYRSIFLADPLSLLSLTPTMLNGEAGLTAGMLAALIYANRKALPLWPTLDTLALGLSIFLIAWHLADFASGSAFGTPSSLPWALELWGEPRHPVQLYEMCAAIVIATILLPRKNAPALPGLTFWFWVALSALSRLFFELFRGDSTTLLWNLHSLQIIAWLAAATALWQIGRIRKHFQLSATDQPDD